MAKEAGRSKGGSFSTKGTLGCLMQNKKTPTMVARFLKGEKGIPLAPKIPQKKNYMGPWSSCGFVTFKKQSAMVVGCSRLLKGGTPKRKNLKVFKLSNVRMHNKISMVVRSKVIKGTLSAKGTITTPILGELCNPKALNFKSSTNRTHGMVVRQRR